MNQSVSKSDDRSRWLEQAEADLEYSDEDAVELVKAAEEVLLWVKQQI